MNLLCPQCKEFDFRSTVRILRQEKNTEEPEIFWDEAGDKHIHSTQWNKEYYRCSLNHSWSKVYYPPACIVCGWSYREADP